MELPGTAIHKQILKTLLDLFKEDKNVRAFIIFGSLARGNWDKYSDLDLDVVVQDLEHDNIKQQIKQMVNLLESNNLKVLHYFEEFPNEFVFIFNSLDRMSIRFHLLNDTHPAIISSMKILCGSLTTDEIKSSHVNRSKKDTDYLMLNNKFLEHSIYVELSIKRNKLINAAFFINKMRQIVIEIFVKARNKREFDFEEIADDSIKQAVIKTFTTINEPDLHKALVDLVNLYTVFIEKISLGKIKLKENEKLILKKVVDSLTSEV